MWENREFMDDMRSTDIPVGVQGTFRPNPGDLEHAYQAPSVPNLDEKVPGIVKGSVTIVREDTGEVIYRDDNVITNVSRWLFSSLMATLAPSTDPQPLALVNASPLLYGVWGLALGAGSPSWTGTTPPTETPTQVALYQEIARVRLSRVNFVSQDSQGNWNPLATLSTNVGFYTTVNATLNNLNQAIKEMGLIGGGMAGTNMLTAPYFSGNPAMYPDVPTAQNTVTLINYKTFPALLLPQGVNFIFGWILEF